MIYTESEKNFLKYHSMGCGYSGEFQEKKPIYPGDPVILVCPSCGSEYRPEQELNGEVLSFAGDSIDMFTRALDVELIEELDKRGYKVEKKTGEFWKEA